MKKFLLLIGVILLSCHDDDKTKDPVLCTLEARPGLEITIKDAMDDIFLVEGVEVVATDNEYVETLENITGTNVFIGAYERKGVYTIVVNKTGYATSTNGPVIVNEDICHVITESLEVLLRKN